MAGAVTGLDGGAAATLQDIHHFFIEMFLRVSCFCGWDLQHVHVDEVAAAAGERVRAVDTAHARPGFDLHVEEVHAEAFDDGHTFRVNEIEVRINQVPRPRRFGGGTTSVGGT